MLVLTRRRGESIIINGNIEVKIAGFCGKNAVELAIQAPIDVSVHRKEIQEKIDREKQEKLLSA